LNNSSHTIATQKIPLAAQGANKQWQRLLQKAAAEDQGTVGLQHVKVGEGSQQFAGCFWCYSGWDSTL
jgi:hypothetical protein